MSEHPLLSPELLAIKTPLQRRPRQEPELTAKPEDSPPVPSPEDSIYSSTGPLAGDFYAETRQFQWHPQPRYAPAASLPPSESDALAAAIQLPHPPPMAVRSHSADLPRSHSLSYSDYRAQPYGGSLPERFAPAVTSYHVPHTEPLMAHQQPMSAQAFRPTGGPSVFQHYYGAASDHSYQQNTPRFH
jgi:hypothetical protein